MGPWSVEECKIINKYQETKPNKGTHEDTVNNMSLKQGIQYKEDKNQTDPNLAKSSHSL